MVTDYVGHTFFHRETYSEKTDMSHTFLDLFKESVINKGTNAKMVDVVGSRMKRINDKLEAQTVREHKSCVTIVFTCLCCPNYHKIYSYYV